MFNFEVLKKTLVILLSFAFLLPSFGVHIGIKHCTAVANESLYQNIKSEQSKCCQPDMESSCCEYTEIIQAPIYQDSSIVQKVNFDILPFIILPSLRFRMIALEPFKFISVREG